jgi:type I site-specific restriction endonuclease
MGNTEGFDNPGVECIIMARPTKSRALYAQMAGRSMRPLPGTVDDLIDAEARREAIQRSPKPNCLIVDFSGNSGRHKLMSTADILGGNVSDEAIELAVRRAKESAVPVDMTEELKKAEEELRKKLEESRLREEARKSRLVAKVKYTSTYINPFNVLQIEPMRVRGWDAGKTLSERQRGVILKMGVNPDSIPYAQGRQLVIEQIRRWQNKLASVKQIAIIKKRQPDLDARNLKFEDASKIISEIAIKENWRKKY